VTIRRFDGIAPATTVGPKPRIALHLHEPRRVDRFDGLAADGAFIEELGDAERAQMHARDALARVLEAATVAVADAGASL